MGKSHGQWFIYATVVEHFHTPEGVSEHLTSYDARLFRMQFTLERHGAIGCSPRHPRCIREYADNF